MPEEISVVPRPDVAAVARIDGPIRVLVIDDHALYRRGLELVLSHEPDIEVVGEGADGHQAVDLAATCAPDVVIMDVRMPNCGGIEACQLITAQRPQVKVIMLTTSNDERDLYESIRAGATGYLLKDIPPEDVAAGVRAVYQGQSLISPSMTSTLLTEFAAMIRRSEARDEPSTPKLTQREMQVLGLLAQGRSNRDIAAQLYISGNTVKNHVRNILEKLAVNSRMEAALYALREGLVGDQAQ